MADDQVLALLERIAEKLGTEPDSIDEFLGVVLVRLQELEKRVSEMQAMLADG